MGRRVSRCLKLKQICVKRVSRPLRKTPRGNHVVESPFCSLIYVRCPNLLPRMLSRSGDMQAVITMRRMKPNSQHEPMLINMPYGTARVAFAASSLMWTQLSKPVPAMEMSQLVSFDAITLTMFASPFGLSPIILTSNRPNWRQPREHECLTPR